jgi:hypothetical protein
MAPIINLGSRHIIAPRNTGQRLAVHAYRGDDLELLCLRPTATPLPPQYLHRAPRSSSGRLYVRPYRRLLRAQLSCRQAASTGRLRMKMPMLSLYSAVRAISAIEAPGAADASTSARF